MAVIKTIDLVGVSNESWRDAAQQALDAAVLAVGLPKRLNGGLTRLEDGSLAVASPRLEQQVKRLDRTVQRSASALVFGALLIAGSVVRADDTVLGNVLMIVSLVPLLHGLWAGRSGL